MIDPTLPLAVIVACGLVARHVRNVYAENSRLRSGELLARQCMRDAMANRDEVVKELWDLKAEHTSLLETAVEMQLELDEYRREETMRGEVSRVVANARAN